MESAKEGWIAKSRGGGSSMKGKKSGGKSNSPKYGAMHEMLGKAPLGKGKGPTKVKK